MTSPVSAAHIRLFLSYGRADALELAHRLKADLQANGYTVWMDVEQIVAGTPWGHSISDSLDDAQLLVAVLSPHSVRRSRGAGSVSGDSVCLDEIAYARFSRGIPIVPVMAQRCEPPFNLFRLDYVDLVRWTDARAYQAGFQRLLHGIASTLSTGQSPLRSWDAVLQPIEFEEYQTSKRQHFVGRQWLFDKIDQWSAQGTEQALLITGGPGVGKSALTAELAERNPGGRILACYFCRANSRETLQPYRFVQTLAAMIASRVRDYAAKIETPALLARLADSSCQSDPGTAWEKAVLEPLNRLPAPPGGARLVLIDALDESLGASGSGQYGLIKLLAERMEQLPSWLRIVATTRPEKEILMRLSGLRAFRLDADSERNRQDLSAFIAARLQTPTLQAKLTASGLDESTVRRRLLDAGGDNFLYVTQALQDVERDLQEFANLDQLPLGMDGIYLRFFERVFPEQQQSYRDAQAVLQVMVAAYEAQSADQLAAAAGLDPEENQLADVFKALASFLSERDGRYALFHKSLGDWLVNANCPYRASRAKGNQRLADTGWEDFRKNVASLSPYHLRYLAAHLMGAARWDDLGRLLTTPAYLERRCRESQVFSLIRDLSMALESWPADHVGRPVVDLLDRTLRQEVHFIAKHPECLFQCLWNDGWWHNNPAAAEHYEGQTSAGDTACLQELLQRWRVAKAQRLPQFVWVRRLRPPSVSPGSGQRAVLTGHTAAVHALAVSPDGWVVASGSLDGTVRLWRVRTSREAHCLKGHEGAVLALAFTPDSRCLISGGQDCTVRLWDAETGRQLQCLSEHVGWVISVAVSPSGNDFVSGSDDGCVRIWDLAAGREKLRLPHGGHVCRVAYSPTELRIASADEEGSVKLWDAISGSLLHVWPRQGQEVRSLSFSADGRLLAAGGNAGGIAVWNMATQQLVQSTTNSLAFAVVASFFDLQGNSLVSVDVAGNAWRTELQGGTVVLARPAFTGKGGLLTLCASCDGRFLFSGGDDGYVRVWQADEWLRGVRPDSSGQDVVISPRDQEAAPVRPAARLRGHKNRVRCLAYSPNGRILASGGEDATVRLWDAERGTELHILLGHQATVRDVAFSPDSRLLVSASEDRTARLWDVETGQVIRTLTGHCGKVVEVDFSPDGLMVITQGWDEKRVWNTVSGECQRSLPLAQAVEVFALPQRPSPWRVVQAEQELELVGGDGRTVARVPGRAELLSAHPHRDAWAASQGNYVTLFCLERG